MSYDQGFLNGSYYPVSKAREMLTYEGDKPLLDEAYKIYKKSMTA